MTDNWKVRRVKDLFTLGRGRVISSIEIATHQGKYPVYSSQSRDNGCMGHIDTFDFEGDYVTWTTDGANAGTVFYRNGQFNCTNVCGTLKAKDTLDIDHRFMAFQLGQVAKRHVSYIGNPKLMNGVMAEVELLKPPYSEQRTIATILDIIDEAIAAAEAQLVKQEKIKQGLLQDLLTRGIDEAGQIRPHWDDRPDLYRRTELRNIPISWTVKRIGDVCESLVPGRDKPELDGGGIPWVTIPDIQDDSYVYGSKSNLSLSRLSIKRSNARLMPVNTVLMSCVGEFGISAIAKVELVANQQLHGFVCGNNILPEWLMMQIRMSKPSIELMATQTTIAYLNKTGCESIKIVLPEINEQQRLLSMINEFTDSMMLERKQINKLNLLKTGLMQDLLTGQRRVTPELIRQVETLTGNT